jgi:hypothetical protein
MQRMMVLALTCLAALVTVGSAQAKSTKKISLTSTVGNIGGAKFAGDLKGTLGPGAVTMVSSDGGNGKLKVDFKIYTATGSLVGTALITATQSGPEGTQGTTTYLGSGKITKGTGRYKGTTGAIAVSGVSPPGVLTINLKVTGKLALSS